MSKLPKKNAKTRSGNKTAPVRSKRPAYVNRRGRLIALEGTRGKDLNEAAQRFARKLGNSKEAAGWSQWDASNTFYEMRMGKAKSFAPPPRTLLLLYASDLMFRLRWEIEPAVNEGRTVVAAPYVETAVAVGVAMGLSKDWLLELFSFAPKPATSLRLKEKAKVKDNYAKDKGKKDKKRSKREPGFVEFCCNTLAATSPDWDPVEVRGAVMKYLDELGDKDGVVPVRKKLPPELSGKNGT